VKEEVKPSKIPNSKRNRSTQDILPSGALDDNKWGGPGGVVLTMIHWLGNQKTPWSPTKKSIKDSLRITCKKIYNLNLANKIIEKPEIYKLVSLCFISCFPVQ
jgi:hypothetical protein